MELSYLSDLQPTPRIIRRGWVIWLLSLITLGSVAAGNSVAVAATVGDVAWKSAADKPEVLRLESQIYLEKGDKHVRAYLRRVAVEGGHARDMKIHDGSGKKAKPFLERSCSGRFFEVRVAEVVNVGFEISLADLTGDGLQRREEAAILLELESRGKIILSLQIDRPTEAVFPEQRSLRMASIGPSLTQEELKAFEVELDSRLRTDSENSTLRTSRARLTVSFDNKSHKRALGETVVERVCFVTNRAKSNKPAKKWAVTFSAERSDKVIYGQVDVTIPAQVITGKIKKNAVIPVDPLLVTPKLERENLTQDALIELLSDASDDDVILYVHGYNNSFEESLQRAAQLKHELNFEGSVIAFSWPSLGETFVTRSIEAAQKKPSLLDRMVSPLSKPYLRDWNIAAESEPALASLIRLLLDRREESGGTARIHLLAHSMGNRVLLGALHRLELSGAFCDQPEPIENVVLLAPDVAVADFEHWRTSANRASRRLTHYYSTEDVPLMLSQKVNRDQRAGLCQVNCVRGEGYDTICVDEINSYFSGLGHLYYGNSRIVLRDLHYLLVLGMTAHERSFHLQESTAAKDQLFPEYRFTKGP
jgi:esterase/lipase superfamily enzyme